MTKQARRYWTTAAIRRLGHRRGLSRHEMAALLIKRAGLSRLDALQMINHVEWAGRA